MEHRVYSEIVEGITTRTKNVKTYNLTTLNNMNPTNNTRGHSGAPEGYIVLSPLLTPVLLL
jgi:hypothetical protein